MKKSVFLLMMLSIKAVTLAFFIMLGSACGSSPSALQIRNVSHKEIPFSDPRVPDKYNKRGGVLYYSNGTWAPQIPLAQQAMLEIGSYMYLIRSINNINIRPRMDFIEEEDGKQVIFLAPGTYDLNFVYRGRAARWAPGEGTDILYLDFPNQNMKVTLQAGNRYYIDHEFELANPFQKLVGRAGRYYVTLDFYRASNLLPERATGAKVKRKYLEPFDPSIPIERQSYLETRDGIFITSFNGVPVCWGWERKKSTVTIAIPPGFHEIKYVSLGTTYTVNVFCDSGQRLVLNEHPNVINVTNGRRYSYDNNGLAYNERGNMYYRQREYDLAIADYTEAIRITPYAVRYNNRGMAYREKGDLDRAIADFEAALRLDPNHAAAKQNLENAMRARTQ